MCKTIKQKVKFNASTETVYELLADSKKHQEMTGENAVISSEVGGRFSAYNGYITGINVDLLPGKRIVLAWRGKDFPEGIFSMAAFTLVPAGGRKTELVLIHRGVPKALIPSIEKMWRESYWEKIKIYIIKENLQQVKQ